MFTVLCKPSPAAKLSREPKSAPKVKGRRQSGSSSPATLPCRALMQCAPYHYQSPPWTRQELEFWGLRFRVLGLGVRVGSGFRVSGFRV